MTPTHEERWDDSLAKVSAGEAWRLSGKDNFLRHLKEVEAEGFERGVRAAADAMSGHFVPLEHHSTYTAFRDAILSLLPEDQSVPDDVRERGGFTLDVTEEVQEAHERGKREGREEGIREALKVVSPADFDPVIHTTNYGQIAAMDRVEALLSPPAPREAWLPKDYPRGSYKIGTRTFEYTDGVCGALRCYKEVVDP